MSTGVAFESSLEVACFEFPYFDGAVFGGGGDLSVGGVEGEGGDVEFVAFVFELGGCFR